MGTIAILYCNFGPPEVLGQSAELNDTDFSMGAVLIGRNPNVAIPIPDEEVSRIHCNLNYSKDGFTLADENSTNGTWINGEKLEPNHPYKLRHEDEIKIGHTSFIFSLTQPEYNRNAEQEMAYQLLRKYGWQIAGVKGFRYWVVPTLHSLKVADPEARKVIKQAFESSARIELDLKKHAGKRVVMEKYQVTKDFCQDCEAYILFLNGRITGAYVVDPDNDSELVALNETFPTNRKLDTSKATRKARGHKLTDPFNQKELVGAKFSNFQRDVYPE